MSHSNPVPCIHILNQTVYTSEGHMCVQCVCTVCSMCVYCNSVQYVCVYTVVCVDVHASKQMMSILNPLLEL